MFIAFLIVFIIVFLFSFGCQFSNKKDKISEKIGVSFGLSALSMLFCLLAGIIGEEVIINNLDDYEWEAQYDKHNKVVIDIANDIELIDYNGDVYYRFIIINESGLLESITTSIDNIEEIRVCGVKPSYVPIKSYRCLNPNYANKWFGTKDVTYNETQHCGKLVIDDDVYIKSNTYKLVEM